MNQPDERRIDVSVLRSWAHDAPSQLRTYVENRLRNKGPQNPAFDAWDTDVPAGILIRAFKNTEDERLQTALRAIASDLADEWARDCRDGGESDLEYLGELAFLCESIGARAARPHLKSVMERSQLLGGDMKFPARTESWLWLSVACLGTREEVKQEARRNDWERILCQSADHPDLQDAAYTALRRTAYRSALGELPRVYRWACRSERPFSLLGAIRGLCVQPNADVHLFGRSSARADRRLAEEGLIRQGEFVEYVANALKDLSLHGELQILCNQQEFMRAMQPLPQHTGNNGQNPMRLLRPTG